MGQSSSRIMHMPKSCLSPGHAGTNMGRRDSTLIERRDAGIAAVLAFILGLLVCGIILLGGKIPLRCFEGGNIADWMAALGTWIIGYGAWRIARESHSHRVQEANERAARERSTRNASLWQVMSKATATKTWQNRASAFAALPAEEQTARRLLTLLHVALTVLRNTSWSDAERALLSMGGNNALTELEFEIMAQVDTLTALQTRLSEDGENFAKERPGVVQMLTELGDRMSKDAESVASHVRALISPWTPC